MSERLRLFISHLTDRKPGSPPLIIVRYVGIYCDKICHPGIYWLLNQLMVCEKLVHWLTESQVAVSIRGLWGFY